MMCVCVCVCEGVLALFLTPSSLCQCTHDDRSWASVYGVSHSQPGTLSLQGFQGIVFIDKAGGGRTQSISRNEKLCSSAIGLASDSHSLFNIMVFIMLLLLTTVDIFTTQCTDKELNVFERTSLITYYFTAWTNSTLYFANIPSTWRYESWVINMSIMTRIVEISIWYVMAPCHNISYWHGQMWTHQLFANMSTATVLSGPDCILHIV